jgi:hypothetical protein
VAAPEGETNRDLLRDILLALASADLVFLIAGMGKMLRAFGR